MNNEFSLNDKLVLITGAARGNGAAMAEGMAKAGARVVLVDVDSAAVEETAAALRHQGAKVWSFGVDVSDIERCEALAEEVTANIGHLDVLVNNAGILKRIPFGSDDAHEALHLTLSVNVLGMFLMAFGCS